jgi:hypothetical protein
MQKAYASYQVTQLIGRFSWLAGRGVHVLEFKVLKWLNEPRLASVGSTSVALFQFAASQPVSYVPGLALFSSP